MASESADPGPYRPKCHACPFSMACSFGRCSYDANRHRPVVIPNWTAIAFPAALVAVSVAPWPFLRYREVVVQVLWPSGVELLTRQS